LEVLIHQRFELGQRHAGHPASFAQFALVAASLCSCGGESLVGTTVTDARGRSTWAGIEWHALLAPREARATGDATVQMSAEDKSFRASLTIHHDFVTRSRPWHVHYGTCQTGSPIAGEDGDYPRLKTDSEGAGSSTARIDVGLDPTASLHVDVHHSEAEPNRLIACGELVVW
jgi:hypothetical protein